MKDISDTFVSSSLRYHENKVNKVYSPAPFSTEEGKRKQAVAWSKARMAAMMGSN